VLVKLDALFEGVLGVVLLLAAALGGLDGSDSRVLSERQCCSSRDGCCSPYAG
jgi:hypothetical protein